jgi:SLT domain-containing protein
MSAESREKERLIKKIRDATGNKNAPLNIDNILSNYGEKLSDEIYQEYIDYFNKYFEINEEGNYILKPINESGEGYATGTTSAKGGVSLVGEGGPELRVLNKGDGIIPTDLTKNLMTMAQSPSSLVNPITNNSDTQTISIGNISLPNVSNVDEFITEISKLGTYNKVSL